MSSEFKVSDQTSVALPIKNKNVNIKLRIVNLFRF